MDGVTYSNSSGDWNTSAGSFYWPVKGELNFYCYAPETPGKTGTFAIGPSSQTLTGFAPFPTAATQQDLVYAKATGSLAANATSGLDVNFSHALSEITVQAKNTNAAYTVEVSGVKLGNVSSEGDFTFPSVAGADASWSIGDERSDYTTEWQNATTLSSTVSSLDASNTAFMLIPQQLAAQAKAIDGSYIALKVKITNHTGSEVYDGWTYVGVSTNWERGNRYDYTIDFSSGLGQDENGDPILNSTDLSINVSVNPWDNVYIELPLCISGHNLSNIENKISVGSDYVTVTMFDDNTWKYEVEGWKPTNIDFKNMPSLESVNLSSLDSRAITDMSQMFMRCNELTKVRMYGMEFENVANMSEMFSGCTSLTSLDLTNKVLDIDKVTDMSQMFYNCSSLENMDMRWWHANKITDISGMFMGCTSLSTVNMPQNRQGTLKNMTAAFENCTSLTKVDMDDFYLHNVTSMSELFSGCTSLKTFYFPTSTEELLYAQYMFRNCSSLERVSLHSWSTPKVTHMNGMFWGCTSLKEIYLDWVNVSNVVNMNGMFYNCSSLEILDIEGWNITGDPDMGGMFRGCGSLKEINMIGCNDATVEKIKQALTSVGLSTNIVKTSY